MRAIRFGWLLPLLVIGCGGDAPPLDELPLRDALRADPAVVASLEDVARERLAARFEAARNDDCTADEVASAATAATEVTALDDARARRSADALVVGQVADGVARPVAAAAGAGAPVGLPPLEGEVATSTAALETRALAGSAGALLRGLLATSGARRLERVVGWPTGAIAIGETIYVDAAWLVALAPGEIGADGGATGGTPALGGAAATVAAAGALPDASLSAVVASSSSAALAQSGTSFDAGTVVVPPPPPPSPPPATSGPSFWDACSASSDGCDSTGDSCDTSDGSDSCSGGGDGYDDGGSCSGSGDDGSGAACSAPPDDGADCRAAPGRSHPRDAAIVWLLAPLGFLLGKRR
jgi:hypothetical protein